MKTNIKIAICSNLLIVWAALFLMSMFDVSMLFKFYSAIAFMFVIVTSVVLCYVVKRKPHQFQRAVCNTYSI